MINSLRSFQTTQSNKTNQLPNQPSYQQTTSTRRHTNFKNFFDLSYHSWYFWEAQHNGNEWPMMDTCTLIGSRPSPGCWPSSLFWLFPFTLSCRYFTRKGHLQRYVSRKHIKCNQKSSNNIQCTALILAEDHLPFRLPKKSSHFCE